MTAYRELIERLEKATGRDYDIDLELACEFGPFIRKRYVSDGVAKVAFFERAEPLKGQMAFACGNDTPEARWRFLSTPEYTASIDAALSLVEKMLPDHCCEAFRDRSANLVTVSFTYENGDGFRPDGLGQHAAEPIATCLALLRALEAQSKDKEEGE